MFGSGKRNVDVSQVETVIGQNSNFKGTVVAKGSVRVDGKFDGEINIEGDAVIGETGKITAMVKSRNAVIAGSVTGNVDVAEKLEILPTGKLYGDIKVGTLSINEGAVFKGVCEMQNESKLEPTLVKTTKS